MLYELLRRIGGGRTCCTPIAVAADLPTQQGGMVRVITPPFHSKPRVWKKGWAKKLRIGRLYFYISNCRMKKRPIRDLMYGGVAEDKLVVNKHKLYDRQGGRCPHCGQSFDYEQLELHHILPISRFPELGTSIRNGIMLCHQCHKEVHCNPYKNIRMMEAKAKELGYDLTTRYKMGEVESEQECAPLMSIESTSPINFTNCTNYEDRPIPWSADRADG